MIKSAPTSSLSSRPHGINVSSSLYGKAVKLICGTPQVAPDLIWYNDWKASDHPSNSNLAAITGQGSGKKKTSKKAGAKYYSAACNWVLGHAPCRGLLSIWFNNQKLAVVKRSAAGFISGGQFSFTPHSGESKVTVAVTIPLSAPYTYTAANFVSPVYVRTGTSDASYFQEVQAPNAPGPRQFSIDSTGHYTFNAADAGKTVSIQFQSTNIGSAGTLAGIVAVTVCEPFSATFNDFGGPGSIAVAGHWDRPLWNASYGVPGRIDSGAYRARDPYTWWWDGISPVIHVPSALNGLPVVVYFGVPAIFKSDGTFYSGSITPATLLNLEFEQILGIGSEYTNHEDQRVMQDWCAGLGSIQFDLSIANAMPNMNLEVLGAFAQWPNGDCDVADVVTDICYSGPVLP